VSIGEENIITGVEIKKIEFSSNRIFFKFDSKEQELTFSKLISSIPAYELANLLSVTDLNSEDKLTFSKLLSSISYSPIGILHSKIKNSDYPNKKHGFGFLVPPDHSESVIGTIFTSEMFPDRIETDYTLLTSFIGGSVYPEKSDLREDKNVKLALDELGKILNLSSTPELIKATYWPHAIPQNRPYHKKLITELLQIENTHPIVLHGNYLDGTSIPHQVKRSFEVGGRLAL
jgi:oxygen-dependent protoporphyrinogen oxidase